MAANAYIRRTPEPHTVVTRGRISPEIPQAFYLWEEGYMPQITDYTGNRNGYHTEGPEFRPIVRSVPVPAGVPVRGGVVMCAGGAFIFRGEETDCVPAADFLASCGWQCFIVDYRLLPYTIDEAACDVARAMRFVRARADEWGFDPRSVTTLGFASGGVLVSRALLRWCHDVTPEQLDPLYRDDWLDTAPALSYANALVYSFYGSSESVAERDNNVLRAAKLPPTYLCYGQLDPRKNEYLENYAALRRAGVMVRQREVPDVRTGFGVRGDWLPDYEAWLGRQTARAILRRPL